MMYLCVNVQGDAVGECFRCAFVCMSVNGL